MYRVSIGYSAPAVSPYRSASVTLYYLLIVVSTSTAQKFKGAVMKLVYCTSPFLGFGVVVKRTERS